MSYDVYFKAKLEGVDQYVPVGDEWVNHTSNTATMIKEVCGSYPSAWDGKICRDMYPILMQGISLLKADPDKYRQYEAPNGWGTVEGATRFLEKVAKNCAEFPTAIIEVSY